MKLVSFMCNLVLSLCKIKPLGYLCAFIVSMLVFIVRVECKFISVAVTGAFGVQILLKVQEIVMNY